ncbi:MAG: hypothetical protein M3Q07_11535 [Pseudobdellovibrionaceae bacterium]|nr:hypothetical protein [Pseudobdellovibrionaceae bacterium]
MKKRMFIPPSHRPYVEGTRSFQNARLLLTYKSPRMRRQFIVDLIKGKEKIPGSDPAFVKQVLLELYPGLKKLQAGDAT